MVCLDVFEIGIQGVYQPVERLVTAEDHFTLTIPPSLELDAGTFRTVEADGRELFVVDVPEGTVTVQPAGTNELGESSDDPPAAAILIVTEIGEPGAYAALGADLSMSEEELEQLDAQLSAGFTAEAERRGDMHDISWAGTQIVQLPQTQAIRMRFTGKESSSGTDLVVNMYLIQNYDSMYYMTVTYLVSQQDAWLADLEEAVSSLRFESRGEG